VTCWRKAWSIKPNIVLVGENPFYNKIYQIHITVTKYNLYMI